MPSDTDLDALIREHRVAAIEISDPATRRIVGTTRLDAAEAALRARLAPTTHADDEALLSNLDEAVWCSDRQAVNANIAALRRRLAELRARAETAEALSAETMEATRSAHARAETAERALAECRAKTIDECAALVDRWDAPENAANLIRALKKEPRDA